MHFDCKLRALKMLWRLVEQAIVQQWSYVMGSMKCLGYQFYYFVPSQM
jgi:hypothetical protein